MSREVQSPAASRWDSQRALRWLFGEALAPEVPEADRTPVLAVSVSMILLAGLNPHDSVDFDGRRLSDLLSFFQRRGPSLSRTLRTETRSRPCSPMTGQGPGERLECLPDNQDPGFLVEPREPRLPSRGTGTPAASPEKARTASIRPLHHPTGRACPRITVSTLCEPEPLR